MRFSIFPRRGGRRVDRRDECPCFAVGDLAVCISDTWANSWDDNPAPGDVLRVDRIVEGVGLVGEVKVHTVGLHFETRPGENYWEASGFRKIVDDRQPAEAEFFELIKRPVRGPGVPA